MKISKRTQFLKARFDNGIIIIPPNATCGTGVYPGLIRNNDAMSAIGGLGLNGWTEQDLITGRHSKMTRRQAEKQFGKRQLFRKLIQKLTTE